MSIGNLESLRPSTVLQRMGPDDYAAARIAVGDHVIRIGSACWLIARRFFYRPLIPYVPYVFGPELLPRVGVGGFQYIVGAENQANSAVSYLAFGDLREYSLDTVSHNRRRLVKAAAKAFSVRPITSLEELISRGHQAYLSFYRRTGYRYGSQRRQKDQFAKWAKATFDSPKTILLGGFSGEGLVAVSVSYWVYDKLLYTTFFSDTAALKKGVGELMLHSLRVLTSQHEAIKEFVVRPYQGGNAMDQYYLMRGAKLVQQPARLYLHPLTRCVMRLVLPNRYRLLKGDFKAPSSLAAGEREPNPSNRDGNRTAAGEQR